MKTIPEEFVGQCQCAAVGYRVLGQSATLFACHCTECQRQSASAFGLALWIRNPEVQLLRGELQEWVRTMPSGRRMRCSFCGTCGSRLFHQSLDQSQFISIKPGTLNSSSGMDPVGHIWTRSKQSWVQLSDTALQYEGNPDSFDLLLAAWAARR